jgi:ParB family transcriptional regulator, chromosome partitioning protein
MQVWEGCSRRFRECPVHDPETAARLAEEQAENPSPVMAPDRPKSQRKKQPIANREYAQRR